MALQCTVRNWTLHREKGAIKDVDSKVVQDVLLYCDSDLVPLHSNSI